MVTGFDVGHVGTNGFHNACGFVAQNRRQHVGVGTVLKVQVRMANPAAAVRIKTGGPVAVLDVFISKVCLFL